MISPFSIILVGSGFRDERITGSGINIPDSHHCRKVPVCYLSTITCFFSYLLLWWRSRNPDPGDLPGSRSQAHDPRNRRRRSDRCRADSYAARSSVTSLEQWRHRRVEEVVAGPGRHAAVPYWSGSRSQGPASLTGIWIMNNTLKGPMHEMVVAEFFLLGN